MTQLATTSTATSQTNSTSNGGNGETGASPTPDYGQIIHDNLPKNMPIPHGLPGGR